MTETPRDYQHECLSATGAAVRAGENKNLIVLPTGTGKAVILANLPKPQALNLQPGEQMMVVVHRETLVEQLAEKFSAWNPDLQVGIERERFTANPMCDVVIASIQTVGKGDKDDLDSFSPRLTKFDPDRLRHIAIDEAHHAAHPKSEYHRVLRYAGIYKPDFRYDDPAKTLTLVTATPGRADGLGLETICDRIVFRRDLIEMMTSGLVVDGVLRPWLCEIKAYKVQTDVDISSVSTKTGDFNIAELEEKVNTPNRNQLAVKNYKEFGEGGKFFGFTVDIQHAVDCCQAFNDAGVPSAVLSSKTKREDRKRINEDFAAGKIRGLFSAGVLSEGVDIPDVSCLLMLRPTKSGLLFRQQLRRGFRPHPAPEWLRHCHARGIDPGPIKPYCVVLDFVDGSGRHQLNTVPTLFGLGAAFDMKGKLAVETTEEVQAVQAKLPGVDIAQYKDLAALKSAAERIDLFAKPQIPPEITRLSRLSWLTAGVEGTYQLNLTGNVMLSVKQNTLGQFETYRHVRGIRTQLGVRSTLAAALARGEAEVPQEELVLLKSDSSWRQKPPKLAQIDLLAKMYPKMRQSIKSDQDFAAFVSSRYTRGEVSDLISQKMGQNRGVSV